MAMCSTDIHSEIRSVFISDVLDGKFFSGYLATPYFQNQKSLRERTMDINWRECIKRATNE